MKRIETKRMVLRAFTPNDADALHSLSGQAKPAEEFGERILDYSEDAAVWIASSNVLHTGERGYWAAEEDGKIVGWFYLLPTENEGEAEAGYLIRRDAKGYGLGTEGIRALRDLAGGRVVMRTSYLNSGPQRSMEKIGFQRIREFSWNEGDPPLGVEYAYEP